MSSKPTFELNETQIKKYCDGKTFKKGEDYIDAVSTLILRGDELSVKVYGSMELIDDIQLDLIRPQCKNTSLPNVSALKGKMRNPEINHWDDNP